jgi:hypothetical protein
MRNFSIISILLALAAAAFLWKNLLVNSAPDNLPDPTDYTTQSEYQDEEVYGGTECDENEQESSECDSERVSEELGEMQQQRGQAHDVMMKSFDQKYDKYRDQTNGR